MKALSSSSMPRLAQEATLMPSSMTMSGQLPANMSAARRTVPARPSSAVL